MKVLFVGHDLSYAAFYSAVEAALRQRTHVESRHLYFRPSAQLWARAGLGLRARSPWLLRLLGRWPRQPAPGSAVDLRFQGLANFETNLTAAAQAPGEAARPGDSLRFFRLHAAYRRWVRRALGNDRFDVAVLPGEFRLFEQAALQALRELQPPPRLLFFEAGPPGYVYFDAAGVNAAASFAATGRSALVHAAGPAAVAAAGGTRTTLPSPPVRQALLALDVAWLWLSQATRGLLDLDEYWTAVRNRLQRKAPSEGAAAAVSTLEGQHRVVFIGQVRNDVNHTHFGIDEQTLAARLQTMLQDDQSMYLIWRDHPLERSEQVLHQLQALFPGRVGRVAATSLPQLLTRCEGAVTVNSNGGLETLQAGLPVFLLGQSYFAGLTGVCRDADSFRVRREAIRSHGPDGAIQADAHRFLRDCFLPIDYRGEDFSQAHLAAHLILSTQP